MADNVSITAGSGTTVGTDERTINSVAVQVQRVDEQASTAFATGQVTPTTTAATLLAARDTRKTVTFLNLGTQTVYVGPATVTTANGFPIAPGAALTMPVQALIQCIIATGTASSFVAYVEYYDS